MSAGFGQSAARGEIHQQHDRPQRGAGGTESEAKDFSGGVLGDFVPEVLLVRDAHAAHPLGG